ncbi:hypothetical protein DFA_09171 [Cavenderia fasciculata]|uniref:Uncharacterized protein n=1 Tax=Cavenderia fasciculata TaxID=261658 RepID=F4Q6W4_CACFS|nr:uncharacterized protein DFA_09171 [Cavenderia fasciculata]EGG16146.1 hypothetical protein DFA_09171 [Cavenderia fasciculata]|eukprot:XP_004352599.1 hypothetical protein DFA_09171 [Cavenderia fasciculata]
MMIKQQLIAVFLILAVVFAGSADAATFKLNSRSSARLSVTSAKDFGEFLLGFIEGLEISTSSHSRACIADTTRSVSEFVSAYEEISKGFSEKSAHTLGAGFKVMGEALLEVPILWQECDISGFISEIKGLASKLEEGAGGVLDVIIKEAINIFHHGHDLTSDFHGAIADEKSHNWSGFGVNVGKIVGVLLKD